MITFLLLGMGVAVLIDLIKAVVPWPLAELTKIVLTLALCAAGAVSLERSWRLQVLVALGAIGIAKLTHEVTDYLSVAGDDHKVRVMQIMGQDRRQRAPRRNRRGAP